MDEKSPLVDNEQSIPNQNKSAILNTNISIIDETLILPDGRTIGYRLCNYNSSDNTQKVVIFFPGAGFGRTHSPFSAQQQDQILSQNNIGLIIIERPGYGQSTAQSDNDRTYKSWSDDIKYICKNHFKFDKKVYFMAHSAGCPHLLAVANYYPELIQNMAIVCPPNPVHGNAPSDRPNEEGARSIQRCCVLNCLCCLICCFKPLLNKWRSDPAEFTKFAKSNFVKNPVEKEFFEDNPEWLEQQEDEFKYAVSDCKGDGTAAMIQDMFIINSKEWGFKIRDIELEGNENKIFVWYGTKDDAAPNGKWYCDTLKNAVERRLDDYGHAAIFIKNTEILMDLISE